MNIVPPWKLKKLEHKALDHKETLNGEERRSQRKTVYAVSNRHAINANSITKVVELLEGTSEHCRFHPFSKL